MIFVFFGKKNVPKLFFGKKYLIFEFFCAIIYSSGENTGLYYRKHFYPVKQGANDLVSAKLVFAENGSVFAAQQKRILTERNYL